MNSENKTPSDHNQRFEAIEQQLSFKEHHQNFIESMKLYYDLFKHLTTLSTGSIVLAATLLEKVFRDPLAVSLIAFSFGAFLLSIVFSLSSMLLYAARLRHSAVIADPKTKIAGIRSVAFASVTFLLALLLLGIFAIINLRR